VGPSGVTLGATGTAGGGGSTITSSRTVSGSPMIAIGRSTVTSRAASNVVAAAGAGAAVSTIGFGWDRLLFATH